MKALLPILLIMVFAGCESIGPGETKATVYGYYDSVTGCAGGYQIRTESGEDYDTYVMPKAFTKKLKLPIDVWIRFERVVQTGGCSVFTQRIDIKTIRKR